MNTEFQYTVLMSVYEKVECEQLRTAIDSMLNQTLFPKEFVVVKDGPLTSSLDVIINEYKTTYPELFKIVEIEENVGLGSAYNIGTEHCSCDYIAIMDSDDYSVNIRCEEEAKYFIEHPDVDIVGCNAVDFFNNINNEVAYRIMPETHEECVKFAHSRCPLVHPTTMIKKTALLNAGGYQKCMYAEDYNLYVRMILKGYKMYNIQKTLLYVRVSKDSYSRRGGIDYLKNIINLKKDLYRLGFYSLFDVINGIVIHTIVCVVPNKVRTYIYLKLLRKNHGDNR